jgi:predicted RNase H-like HicB family nuclease
VKFLVTYFADEDGGYVADCPALHGCVSHGLTIEEAEADIKEAIRLWLETMADDSAPLEVVVAEVEVQVA